MCNNLCLTKIILTSSTFFNFPKCTVVNFQNLKVVHLKKFFEEELVEVEKWEVEMSTHIIC